ncbi:MAG: peptidoglycan editing factor PgeF [Bacteroidaceae bacterium]|nr:peptidoglycan editing factor PgeF [Bacteroidaceae bacterium]
MRSTTPLHLYPMPDDRVTAFSTTRHGGCGSGAYATLNCTPYVGDEPAVVRANQEQLCRQLGITPEKLVIPYQTHSCNILTIDEAFMHLSADARQAMLQDKDAVMTHIEGLCLCVSTADCIPILLYDATHRAVAAVHAGWRGTVARIVTAVLDAMHEAYGTRAADVHAIIGPGISLDAFEVGIEVYETFREATFDMEQIASWHAEKEKYHLDLPAANRLQLLAAGVPREQIHESSICTYTQHHDFFSARRMGIKSGRILNGIIMK